MIVAHGERVSGEPDVLIIGLIPEDLEILKSGLTLSNAGKALRQLRGLSAVVLCFDKSHEEILRSLEEGGHRITHMERLKPTEEEGASSL